MICRPFRQLLQYVAQPAQTVKPLPGDSFSGFLVHFQRPFGQQECKRLRQFWQGRASILHVREGCSQTRSLHRLECPRPPSKVSADEKAVIVSEPQEVRVNLAEFVQIEPPRCAIDSGDVESRNCLFVGEDLLVAVAPADPQK
jgi:hypothetical protein